MRRQRNVSVIVVSVLVGFFLLKGLLSWYFENQRVKDGFNKVFTAIQQQRKDDVTMMFYPTTLPEGYFAQVFKYKLLGWKIISISGQPWPMDMPGSTIDINVECYYQMPKQMPKGGAHFTPTAITHPRYGACMKIPYKLSFLVDNLHDGKISPPDTRTGENWMGPFEGPV